MVAPVLLTTTSLQTMHQPIAEAPCIVPAIPRTLLCFIGRHHLVINKLNQGWRLNIRICTNLLFPQFLQSIDLSELRIIKLHAQRLSRCASQRQNHPPQCPFKIYGREDCTNNHICTRSTIYEFPSRSTTSVRNQEHPSFSPCPGLSFTGKERGRNLLPCSVEALRSPA